jgi:hypothetical protein
MPARITYMGEHAVARDVVTTTAPARRANRIQNRRFMAPVITV